MVILNVWYGIRVNVIMLGLMDMFMVIEGYVNVRGVVCEEVCEGCNKLVLL